MSANRLSTQTSTNGQERRKSMLVPVAYSESVFPALRLARSSRVARRIAKALLTALFFAIILMAFAPWQQSVTGSGSVLAYSPEHRPQVIQAPIKGRIERWGKGIVENATVTKGQVIAEIRDLDESYAQRLKQQLNNGQQGVVAAKQQLAANERALTAAHTVVESIASQVTAYEIVKRETMAAQDAYVEMATKKVMAERQQLEEYQAALPQLKAEHVRTKRLQEAGNISLQKFQEIDRKLTEAEAKVRRAEAYVEAALSDLKGKKRYRNAEIEKAQVAIDDANAKLRKANNEVSKAEGDIAKAQQELNKAEQEVLKLEVSVSRQETQVIKAPFDGYVVQITPNMGTAVLKEGDSICTIVPKTTDRSVQIWLDGNDAPLVEPGRHVRLQFEGWPALQFSGWPSVAVGTFGGQVVSVDATDNGKGKFRVLVRPDLTDQNWPEERFSEARGPSQWLGLAEASPPVVRSLATTQRLPTGRRT